MTTTTNLRDTYLRRLGIGIVALVIAVAAAYSLTLSVMWYHSHEIGESPAAQVSSDATAISYSELTDKQQNTFREDVGGERDHELRASSDTLTAYDYIKLDGEYYPLTHNGKRIQFPALIFVFLALSLGPFGFFKSLANLYALLALADYQSSRLSLTDWPVRLTLIFLLAGGLMGGGAIAYMPFGTTTYVLSMGPVEDPALTNATVVTYEEFNTIEQQTLRESIDGTAPIETSPDRFTVPPENRSHNYSTINYIKSDGEYYRLSHKRLNTYLQPLALLFLSIMSSLLVVARFTAKISQKKERINDELSDDEEDTPDSAEDSEDGDGDDPAELPPIP